MTRHKAWNLLTKLMIQPSIGNGFSKDEVIQLINRIQHHSHRIEKLVSKHEIHQRQALRQSCSDAILQSIITKIPVSFKLNGQVYRITNGTFPCFPLFSRKKVAPRCRKQMAQVAITMSKHKLSGESWEGILYTSFNRVLMQANRVITKGKIFPLTV